MYKYEHVIHGMKLKTDMYLYSKGDIFSMCLIFAGSKLQAIAKLWWSLTSHSYQLNQKLRISRLASDKHTKLCPCVRQKSSRLQYSSGPQLFSVLSQEQERRHRPGRGFLSDETRGAEASPEIASRCPDMVTSRGPPGR